MFWVRIVTQPWNQQTEYSQHLFSLKEIRVEWKRWEAITVYHKIIRIILWNFALFLYVYIYVHWVKKQHVVIIVSHTQKKFESHNSK